MLDPRIPLKFESVTPDHHKCYVEQEGDWLVFRCPACADYERRIHSKTGEMKSKYDRDNHVRHYGIFVRPGFGTGLYQPN